MSLPIQSANGAIASPKIAVKISRKERTGRPCTVDGQPVAEPINKTLARKFRGTIPCSVRHHQRNWSRERYGSSPARPLRSGAYRIRSFTISTDASFVQQLRDMVPAHPNSSQFVAGKRSNAIRTLKTGQRRY